MEKEMIQGDRFIELLEGVRKNVTDKGLIEFISYLLEDPADRISAMRAVMCLIFVDDPILLMECNLRVARGMRRMDDERIRLEKMGTRGVDPSVN